MARSYVTNFRKGRIESPGYDKMLAIARAMEFPPEAWFEDPPGEGALVAAIATIWSTRASARTG